MRRDGGGELGLVEITREVDEVAVGCGGWSAAVTAHGLPPALAGRLATAPALDD